MQELIVDNFAGGGGASTGIELAIGRSVDIAINHDPVAIAMHKANHPETKHYCESVWDVNPRKVTAGRPVALCWFSPDCTHFSKAKGGKPRDKTIRGLAWVALRWAATVRPRVIILENVEEFVTWGPLTPGGYPDPKQKGRTFRSFVNALHRQGYDVEWRELRACDYGAPTIRKRFFLIARCDGRPILWPEPTHGDPNSPEVRDGKLKPWRMAAEIIDWSIPCPSIFERKRPLAENTLRRIARGLYKFIIDNPNPFIVPIGAAAFVSRQFGQSVGHGMDKPLGTITAGGMGKSQLVTAFLAKHYGGNYNGPGSDLADPISTITTKDHNALVAAHFVQYHSETQGREARGQTLDRPILTLDTSNRYGLVTSHLVKMRGTNIGQPITEPLQTITAGGNHFGEVRAFLLKYYGSADNGQRLNEPLHTITTKDRFGLVTIAGNDYQIVDIGMRMLEPRELFAAQGFPSTYIIDRDVDGKKYPKSEQVARCGNSVPPQFAEALVRANLPELCIPKGTDRFSWEAMLA
jgi:DNA (cytosine-5)-methyltransferase 1